MDVASESEEKNPTVKSEQAKWKIKEEKRDEKRF